MRSPQKGQEARGGREDGPTVAVIDATEAERVEGADRCSSQAGRSGVLTRVSLARASSSAEGFGTMEYSKGVVVGGDILTGLVFGNVV